MASFKSSNHSALEFSERLLEIEPEIMSIRIPEEIKQRFASRTASHVPAMKMMAEIADKALVTTVRWAKKVPGKEFNVVWKLMHDGTL